jgi:uncharacterized Fe-S cluster protein YjdI
VNRNEGRYDEVVRRYVGDGITVHWEPALCIHVANCLRALPDVFDARRLPWVQLDAADKDAIIAAVRTCPTGALSYELPPAAPDASMQEPTQIEPQQNGPLYLRGRLQVVDADGNVLRESTRLALCRCGHSYNKPYCDLSHRAYGFRD